MGLPERLRELRGDKTPKDCAIELGIDRHNYYKWEKGDTIPNYRTLIDIADYYGVTLDYLVGRTNFADSTTACEQTGLSIKAIDGIRELQKDSTDDFNYIGVLDELLCLEADGSYSKYSLRDLLSYFLHPNGYLWWDEFETMRTGGLTVGEQASLVENLLERASKPDKIRDLAIHLWEQRKKTDKRKKKFNDYNFDILDAEQDSMYIDADGFIEPLPEKCTDNSNPLQLKPPKDE